MSDWQNTNKLCLKPSVCSASSSYTLTMEAAGVCERLFFMCRALSRRISQDHIFSLNLTSLLRQEQAEKSLLKSNTFYCVWRTHAYIQIPGFITYP
jgi:hypothetical protein